MMSDWFIPAMSVGYPKSNVGAATANLLWGVNRSNYCGSWGDNVIRAKEFPLYTGTVLNSIRLGAKNDDVVYMFWSGLTMSTRPFSLVITQYLFSGPL